MQEISAFICEKGSALKGKRYFRFSSLKPPVSSFQFQFSSF